MPSKLFLLRNQNQAYVQFYNSWSCAIRTFLSHRLAVLSCCLLPLQVVSESLHCQEELQGLPLRPHLSHL